MVRDPLLRSLCWQFLNDVLSLLPEHTDDLAVLERAEELQWDERGDLTVDPTPRPSFWRTIARHDEEIQVLPSLSHIVDHARERGFYDTFLVDVIGNPIHPERANW